MNRLKVLSIFLVFAFLISLCGCLNADMPYEEDSKPQSSSEVSSVESVSTPEITSLDNKMSKYFDISLFDEENYADIYLGKKFDINAVYENSYFSVPTDMNVISKNGWNLVEGSDYHENSLVFAKETVELQFKNENGAVITAWFYNSSNSSVRLSKCSIVKFRINNNYPNENYNEFNVCGITNISVLTDIIQTLGTPSHFYEKTENSYYFDYFLEKRDRRNKIRIYVDLENDAVTAVEFSKYK